MNGAIAVEAWWEWMAPMSVQLVALAAVVVAVERLARRWSWPQLERILWLTVLLKLLIPPSLTAPTGATRLAGRVSPAVGAVESAGTSRSAAGDRVLVVCFVVWCAGCVGAAVVAGRRAAQLRRQWLSGASAAPAWWLERHAGRAAGALRLARLPPIVVSASDRAPAVIGFLRPTVVVPAGMLEWDAARQHHVLVHELAHVQRLDPLWNLVSLAVAIAYWFHPVVWLARRRLGTLREVACDERAAGCGAAARRAYRRTLLELARPLAGVPGPQMQFSRPAGQLITRLEWLERSSPLGPRARLAVNAATLAVLWACCVPLAAAPRSATTVTITLDGRSVVDPITEHEPAALADAIDLPPRDEFRGCLQLRFAVMRRLAMESSGLASAAPVVSE